MRVFTHWLAVVSLDGREVIEVDGRRHDIPSGGAYVIQPGSRAELRGPEGSTPVWAHFDLAFDPNRERHPQVHVYTPDLGGRAPWMQPRAVELLGVDMPVVVPSQLQPRFRSLLPEVVADVRRMDPLAALRAAGSLGQLVIAAAELARGAPVAGGIEQRLARAEAVARSNLASGADLGDMARAAGLGRSRFCQVYARLRGRAPGAFLRAERLARAQELLTRAELTVADVAAQVGFADATVFGRFFRSATGRTPGAWRRQGGAS